MFPHNSLSQPAEPFFAVWETMAKFGLHVDNMKLNTQNEE
jgi:hypothetical protein